MITIEVPDENDSYSRISLSGEEFYIRFTYNDTFDYWSFGLYQQDMTPIIPMTKIVPNYDLLYYYNYPELPEGMFGCWSNLEKVRRDSFNDKRAVFGYISYEELVES